AGAARHRGAAPADEEGVRDRRALGRRIAWGWHGPRRPRPGGGSSRGRTQPTRAGARRTVIATPGPDAEAEPTPAQGDDEHSSGRIRSLMSGTRDLVRLVYRDPQHLSERLTLKFIERLGEPSLAWSQRILSERDPKD